jgi:hypothetical protein
MNTLEFLQLVTPTAGQKAVVVPRGINKTTEKPLWFHFAHTEHAAMAERIAALDAKHIYFALGGFKHNAIDEYKGRKQENVEYLRAFWLDIDVAVDQPKKYSTKRAAGEAIAAFVEAYALPEPLVVISGGGLHVYWPLDRDVLRSEWKSVATALKAATRESKLLVDHSRTSDEASILRPVGTFNRKQEVPREVRAVEWQGSPVSIESLAEALKAHTVATVEIELQAPVHGFVAPELSLGANLANVEVAPKVFKRILDKCPQMQWAYEHMQYGADGKNTEGYAGEQVSEPLWRACLSVITRCKNGEQHAHTFSSRYPTYSITETAAKISGVGDMPQSCAKFNELNESLCGKCKYAGKIKSPIVLGIDYVELEPPEIKIEADVVSVEATAVHGFKVTRDELRIAGVNPPFPFKRTDRGVVRVTQVPAVDPDGSVIKGKFVDEDRVLAPYDIYPLFRTREAIDGAESAHYSAYWRIIPVDHKAMVDDVLIPHGDLGSSDTLRRTMSTKAVYTPTDNQHKEVAEYMRLYLQRLGEQHTHPQPTNFGWQGEMNSAVPIDEQPIEFVIGSSRYRRSNIDGIWGVAHDPIYPAASMKQFALTMHSKGSLEGWAKAAAWYADDFAAPQIAAVLLSVGSPFMKFLKRSGVVTMIRGEKGVGKSSVLQLAASAWGAYEYIRGGKSSPVGMETVAACLQNLPVIADDRPEMTDNEVSAEIMMLANGAGKSRGTMVGNSTQPSAAKSLKWLSNSLMSSNKSWVEALGKNKIENEGETARIIELEILRVSRAKWAEIGGKSSEAEYQQLLEINHGVAGPAIVQEFLRAPGKYVDKLREFESDLIDAALARGEAGDAYLKELDPSEYRLQAAAFACALLVLLILRRLKLVTWTPQALVQVALQSISDTCRMTIESRPTKQDVLSQYINEFHGNFVVVTAEGARLQGMPAATGDEQAFGKVPNMRIVGRIDHVEKVTYLDRAAFKSWLNGKGVSESAVIKGLTLEGWDVKADRNTKVTLGRGFAAVSKVQTRVVELRNAALFEKLAGTV